MESSGNFFQSILSNFSKVFKGFLHFFALNILFNIFVQEVLELFFREAKGKRTADNAE